MGGGKTTIQLYVGIGVQREFRFQFSEIRHRLWLGNSLHQTVSPACGHNWKRAVAYCWMFRPRHDKCCRWRPPVSSGNNVRRTRELHSMLTTERKYQQTVLDSLRFIGIDVYAKITRSEIAWSWRGRLFRLKLAWLEFFVGDVMSAVTLLASKVTGGKLKR